MADKGEPELSMKLRLFVLLLLYVVIVREEGLEPSRPKAPEPKSGASANSAIRAHASQKVKLRSEL